MARFPDQVAFFDVGIRDSVSLISPGLIVNALITVHDKAQDGGVDTRNVGIDVYTFTVTENTPFDILYDCIISTRDYFALRAFFQEERLNPNAVPQTGVWNVPLPTSHEYPAIFANDYVPQGVFRNAGRQDILVRPVGLPGFADPFGIPIDSQRGEYGLAVKYQMVRKEMTRFVLKRDVYAF